MRVALILAIFFALAVPSAGASQDGHRKAQGDHRRAPKHTQRHPAMTSLASCQSAVRGADWYRGRYGDWMRLRGAAVPDRGSPPSGCAHARWRAQEWKHRSFASRQSYYRWREEQRTLHDFAFADGNNAWLRAVGEVQRVYPGTQGWLESCSAAEGGWGRWVGYGGQGYSAWLRDSDTVGGPLQFRWSTFRSMYRSALDDLRSRRLRVPSHLRDPDNDVAWRSALGQALAGGWARYTGNDNSHWSASWSNGCG